MSLIKKIFRDKLIPFITQFLYSFLKRNIYISSSDLAEHLLPISIEENDAIESRKYLDNLRRAIVKNVPKSIGSFVITSVNGIKYPPIYRTIICSHLKTHPNSGDTYYDLFKWMKKREQDINIFMYSKILSDMSVLQLSNGLKIIKFKPAEIGYYPLAYHRRDYLLNTDKNFVFIDSPVFYGNTLYYRTEIIKIIKTKNNPVDISEILYELAYIIRESFDILEEAAKQALRILVSLKIVNSITETSYIYNSYVRHSVIE